MNEGIIRQNMCNRMFKYGHHVFKYKVIGWFQLVLDGLEVWSLKPFESFLSASLILFQVNTPSRFLNTTELSRSTE